MNRTFLKKSLIGLLLVAIIVAIGTGIWHYRDSLSFKTAPKTSIKEYKQPWMTVFIHGTFGSFLGFLSLNNVLNDKISGTTYRKLTKLMRDDDFFFADQPILKRGLVSINPTLDITKAGGKKYGAHPIISAYKKISEMVGPEHETDYFYTFGWSGLLSQNSRRFEAIRFYNALSQELEKFHRNGIYPKIRLIAHSHGGNLGLNLAAVHKIIQSPGFKQEKQSGSDNDYEQETLASIFEMMKSLTTRENARKNTDQKVYDYVPTNKNLKVDELVMFGTPIQPETEPFCGSGFFDKVYNFYSDEDMAQPADWVTSKKPVSERRLSQINFPIMASMIKKRPRIVQGRIMINRGLNEKTPTNSTEKCNDANKSEQKNDLSVFQRILAGFFSRQTNDPTHKELWFLCWDEQDNKTGSFLMPLPVVVLTPLLIDVADKRLDLYDIDLHIKESGDMITTCATKHNDEKEQSKKCVSYRFFSDLKEEIIPYRTTDRSHATLFNTVYKHLLKAGYPV